MLIFLSLSNVTFPAGITGLSLLVGNENMPIGDDGGNGFFQKQNGCRNPTKGTMQQWMNYYSA
jgi:hypothetical protein